MRTVCEAIWRQLGPLVLPEPSEDVWKLSASKFRELWHFPNCLAAIDGKYVYIQCPINGGSLYFNYKGFHSTVLLALVGAEYKFLAVDVGLYGKNSDGSVFSKSVTGKKLEIGTLNVPPNTPLVENAVPMPYVIVGDEAFPMKTYLLRPYSKHHQEGDESKKIYNYRLSRALRVFENAFGILASRWKVFRRSLEVQPETVDKVVLASCCLHNMLCKERNPPDETELLCPITSGLRNLQQLRRNAPREATDVRDYFKDYFNSPVGSSPWKIAFAMKNKIICMYLRLGNCLCIMNGVHV